MASLGHVYAGSGRIEEGVPLLQQALALYESAGIGYLHSLSVVYLGEVYLLADRLGDARACADRAATLARERGERGYEVYARRLRGEIAAFSGPPGAPEAEAHYREALAAAEELGMRPLAAHCHLLAGPLAARAQPPIRIGASVLFGVGSNVSRSEAAVLAQLEAAFAPGPWT